jgi:hypothetical protein
MPTGLQVKPAPVVQKGFKSASQTRFGLKGFFAQRAATRMIILTPDEKERARQNRRTGLILLSVAAVFFLGILIRKVMEPSILSLVN